MSEMDDQISRTAMAAAEWWGRRLGAGHAAKREALESALAERVDQALRSGKRLIFLQNDYDPQGILLEAVRGAGIDCRGHMLSGDGIFPRKHDLTVKVGVIEPKEGYGNWLPKIEVA